MDDRLTIEAEVLDEIKAILRSALPEDANVYIYGSRAKGKARPYSDVDLAFDNGGQAMPDEVMSDLRIKFEFSSLPYKVDVTDLNTISDSFRSAIQNDLIEVKIS